MQVSSSPERASDLRGATLVLPERLDAETTGRLWRDAMRQARRPDATPLTVDASAVRYCDATGAALLGALARERERAGSRLEVHALRDDLRALAALLAPPAEVAVAPPRRPPLLARIGRGAIAVGAELRGLVTFVGELTWTLAGLLRHPRGLRLRDTFEIAERAGIGATPIILLVGFLLGLILAFQGAIPMSRFGAQIFIADLIGLAMLRELGPLMASILLTARSGSAFAAEIGTMKVNEEVDALTTMGVDPVRFLVVPRVLAALLVVPALSMLTTAAGLVGGAVVFLSLGYPIVTYATRIEEMVVPSDVIGGLAKAMVFGVIVAAVGCQRGLRTGKGAEAVGASTTSAVVSGIILIAIADGIFAVVFYVLGL